MSLRQYFSTTTQNLLRSAKWSWSLLVWLGIFGYSLNYVVTERWSDDNWQSLYISDSGGYYGYLPATVVYHDYQYHFLDSLAGRYRFLQFQKGCTFCNRAYEMPVNKYFSGVAVLQLPFYIVGHWCSGSPEHPRDGYSFYYVAAVTLGALFYLMAGLWALRKLLQRLQVKDWIIAVVLLTIYAGTNLSYYATWESMMSHVYSFSMVALFLLNVQRQIEQPSGRRLIWIAALLGMTVLLRPVNALIVLAIPFLAGSWPATWKLIRDPFRMPLYLGLALLCGALVISIQLLYYKLEVGKWWVDAYGEEAFDFRHPRMIRFLFSYRNGFFLWAPAMFVAAMGIFVWVRKNTFRFFAFAGFLLLVDWVLSSWWAWNYGGAFGMRPMVEYLPVFAVLLGITLQELSKVRFLPAAITVLLLLPLSAITQIQTWQYRHSILPYDRIKEDMYWRVFLKTDKQYFYIFADAEPQRIPDDAKEVYHYKNDLEVRDTVIKNWETVEEGPAASGTHAGRFHEPQSNPPFWSGYVNEFLRDSSLYEGKSEAWVRVRMKFRVENIDANTTLLFLQERDGQLILNSGMRLKTWIYRPNEWVTCEYNMRLNPLFARDRLRVLPVKDDPSNVWIDDVEIWLYVR